jgi:serine/threonine-protein kinase HipA
MNERKVWVHVDRDGTPRPVGLLWTRRVRDRESASFEYQRSWLDARDRFALGPSLPLGPGAFQTSPGTALHDVLKDSAPDRWGRTLIMRASRRADAAAQRATRTLNEIDFLLGVNDEAREGALRFAESEGGPFLAPASGHPVPPLIDLPALLDAASHVEDDDENPGQLALLLAPGSSLGGARPKASVRLKNGDLAIAKFPSRGDDFSVPGWEMVAVQLARRAGIEVPDTTLQEIGGRRVLISRRFDRERERRIPYLSAMSMLQATDGEHRSYVEIADAVRQNGAAAREDLQQLWRRMVFNLLVSNVDDHLRNHGFLHAGKNGWRLAPAFDLNPVPRDLSPRELTTTIDIDGDPAASVERARSVARQFALTKQEATLAAEEIAGVVRGWRGEAKKRGLTGRECDRMASAFEPSG